MKLNLLLIFLILLSSNLANAEVDEDFFSPSIYTEGNCSTNIWNFISKNNFDSGHVAYIYFSNLDDLYLVSPRLSPGPWFFHVVYISKDDLVFDLDFKKTLSITPITTYFSQQFGDIQTNRDDFKIKLIPAQDYIDKYSSDRTQPHSFYYFLLPEKNSYPEVSFSDFTILF